jgi:subtilisin-like proprotein convertase family protein
MLFKTHYRISRLIIVSVVLFILFALIGIKYERSSAMAAQWSRVNIEVLPGEPSKFIDASARPWVPVAILSSMDFDASTVNPASVRLAGAPIGKIKKSQLRAFLADVNGDGRNDLVVYVSVYSLNLDPGTSEALLTATTFDGQSVSGSQQVSFRAPVVQDSPLSAAAFSDGTVSNPSNINIKDSFTPPTNSKPYPSTITVSGQPTVTKITVSLSNYSHTYPDDVDILVVGPTGAKCLLMADCGGSDSTNNVNLTFDDAFPSLPDESQIATGTYKPTKGTCVGGGSNCVPNDFPPAAPAGPYGTALSVFNGTNPNGTWQLYVIDDSVDDSGAISGGWSLTVNPAFDTDGDGMPDFVEATEGTNPNVKDNDVFNNARWFAMQQYRDFLGREGDPDGITFWTNSINSDSNTRAQVIDSFFKSAEFQGTVSPVTRLYFAYFLRIPDYGGLIFWVTQYRNGASLDTISQAFAQSPEFIATYGSLSNRDFVTLLYNNVLGRPPDQGGLDFWTGKLDSGELTRGQVMLGFSESDEYKGTSFNKVYVTMIYVGMLRRAPDQGGFDFWVNALNNGASGLQLIQGFLNSVEYHDRFLPHV